MGWNRVQITRAAKAGAAADYAAFEAIGLSEMEHARVLDVGCFDGFNTVLKFAPYSGIACVKGIDPCEEAVDRARRACDDPRFSWQVCSLQDYDDADGPFDVVYFSHVLQHLPDKEEALLTAYDLLTPGGFVVVKTVDDGAKASWPDPDRLMSQVLALYDEAVRPYVAHTAHTDRYLGMRCGRMLSDAGFSDVGMTAKHATTVGMDAMARREFFERMVYFRRHVPEQSGIAAQRRMDELIGLWGALFERNDYYFDSPTFAVWGRRPFEGEALPSAARPAKPAQDGVWTLSAMTEDDLSDVMSIESRAFPEPWAPVAFAMELRHNRDASYVVARDERCGDAVVGYVGWWLQGERAVVTRIAVRQDRRRQGLGRVLLRFACLQAGKRGATSMELTVRSTNAGARALYRTLGFFEADRLCGYYARPADDGVVMVKELEGRIGGPLCR